MKAKLSVCSDMKKRLRKRQCMVCLASIATITTNID